MPSGRRWGEAVEGTLGEDAVIEAGAQPSMAPIGGDAAKGRRWRSMTPS